MAALMRPERFTLKGQSMRKPYGPHDPALANACAYCGEQIGEGGQTDAAGYEYCGAAHMAAGPRMFAGEKGAK
jgi:hypothetical protein